MRAVCQHGTGTLTVVAGVVRGGGPIPRTHLRIPPAGAKIERVFHQGSLFGVLAPEFDASFAELHRLALDSSTWVDLAPGWMRGADQVYDHLVGTLPLRQRTGVRMYDRIVDEPRLSAWWRAEHGEPEPLPILHDMRVRLGERYGEAFDSIGFNLYRDGDDSVAWHGDRHRHHVTNPVIAIVSVGAPRPFRLRPRGGGSSISWDLGNGDLFVMGGACQHDWEHTVPKVRVTRGPRLSITFRSL
jgi:alkylated DNA repair dioxygenase AlkB